MQRLTYPYITSVLLLTIGVFFLGAGTMHAFTMKNTNYILEWGNFDSGGGRTTGGGKNVTFSLGQIAPGLYSGTNYKLRAGFQYVYMTTPFTFRITNTNIDFGTLSPTNPVTRTSTLTISNGSAYGYSVVAYEDHQLLVPSSGAMIPDTTCDTGTCTETTGAPWSNTLTYGFGYRCDNLTGTNCVSFPPNYYKQFADNAKNETAQAVMSGTSVGKNKQSTITYKLNISGTQAAGVYNNVITYIATPTY